MTFARHPVIDPRVSALADIFPVDGKRRIQLSRVLLLRSPGARKAVPYPCEDLSSSSKRPSHCAMAPSVWAEPRHCGRSAYPEEAAKDPYIRTPLAQLGYMRWLRTMPALQISLPRVYRTVLRARYDRRSCTTSRLRPRTPCARHNGLLPSPSPLR